MLFAADPWQHALLVQVHSMPDVLQFPVDRQTAERLQSALMGHDEHRTPTLFFCFTSVDEVKVALSIDDIEFVNFLWETSVPVEQPSAGEVDDELTIEIFFRNRPNPLQRKAPDHEEIAAIFHQLQDPLGDAYFLSFTDEDGEIITFGPHHVVMFTSEVALLPNEM